MPKRLTCSQPFKQARRATCSKAVRETLEGSDTERETCWDPPDNSLSLTPALSSPDKGLSNVGTLLPSVEALPLSCPS